MKALVLTTLFLGLIAVSPAESLKNAIISGNKTVHQAMRNRDSAALTKIFRATCTKDFKYVENGQTQNLDQMIAGMKGGMDSMKKVTKADTKIISVTEKGNTGTSNTVHILEGITMGPDKKEHKMGFSGTCVETYVKVNGKWKMSKMVWKSMKMTMDGKPMEGMGGG
jgi:hypothetical protein